MNWYNVFSRFYDFSTEHLYNTVRKNAFEQLRKDKSLLVIDLACGTGQNFPHLIERLGEDTSVIGIDYSAGMLSKAEDRIMKNAWHNIFLVETDARTLSQQQLDDLRGSATKVDAVVCTLGLCVMPNWKQVFEKLFELLKPGGQFLIMDVWAKRRVPQTYWVEMITRANLDRKVWEPLEKISDDYTFHFLSGSPHVHGGQLFVASGFKPK